MIKIKEGRVLLGMKERLYVCTFCGQEHRFFFMSPRKCKTCGKILPDMSDLFEFAAYRARYHFNKE